MTADDLKSILNHGDQMLGSLETTLGPSDQTIIQVLQRIQSNPVIMDVLATLIPKDQLVTDLQAIIQTLQTVDQMIKNGEVDKIRSACQNLQNRPIVLRMMARFL